MDEKLVPILSKHKNDYAKVLALFEDRVMEHAARRVDLFFYLLIAYYKTKLPITLGWSKLQHGKGRFDFKAWEAETNAAHSSIATTLLDKNIIKKESLVSQMKNTNLKIKTSMLCGTHFMDSLNSTIELPPFVNDLDFQIEFIQKGRFKAGDILQQVAQGTLTPIQGLFHFLKMMEVVFDNMLANKIIYDTDKPIPVETKRALVELEKKGTLINKLTKDGKAINDDYIFMLLRLSKSEIAICLDSQKRSKMLAKKMELIAIEVLETPSAHIKIAP